MSCLFVLLIKLTIQYIQYNRFSFNLCSVYIVFFLLSCMKYKPDLCCNWSIIAIHSSCNSTTCWTQHLFVIRSCAKCLFLNHDHGWCPFDDIFKQCSCAEMFLTPFFISLISQRCVCRAGRVSLYSHGSFCFLGKDNAWGQGSVQREFVGGEVVGVWKAFPVLTAEQSATATFSVSLRIWWLFISRMSIVSCHPTGKARETSRKSITKQCVDQ